MNRLLSKHIFIDSIYLLPAGTKLLPYWYRNILHKSKLYMWNSCCNSGGITNKNKKKSPKGKTGNGITSLPVRQLVSCFEIEAIVFSRVSFTIRFNPCHLWQYACIKTLLQSFVKYTTLLWCFWRFCLYGKLTDTNIVRSCCVIWQAVCLAFKYPLLNISLSCATSLGVKKK